MVKVGIERRAESEITYIKTSRIAAAASMMPVGLSVGCVCCLCAVLVILDASLSFVLDADCRVRRVSATLDPCSILFFLSFRLSLLLSSPPLCCFVCARRWLRLVVVVALSLCLFAGFIVCL